MTILQLVVIRRHIKYVCLDLRQLFGFFLFRIFVVGRFLFPTAHNILILWLIYFGHCFTFIFVHHFQFLRYLALYILRLLFTCFLRFSLCVQTLHFSLEFFFEVFLIWFSCRFFKYRTILFRRIRFFIYASENGLLILLLWTCFHLHMRSSLG